MHVHFHIIPREPERGLGITWRSGTLDPARATALVEAMQASMSSEG